MKPEVEIYLALQEMTKPVKVPKLTIPSKQDVIEQIVTDFQTKVCKVRKKTIPRG